MWGLYIVTGLFSLLAVVLIVLNMEIWTKGGKGDKATFVVIFLVLFGCAGYFLTIGITGFVRYLGAL